MKKIIFFLLALLFFAPSTSFAKDSAGVVTYTRGEAWLFRGMESLEISNNTLVYPGDTVSTTITGRVKVSMADGSVMFVGGRSRIKVDDYEVRNGKLQRGSFNVIWGRASFRVSKLNAHRSRFTVRSQMVTLNTLGSTFSVEGWKAVIPSNSAKEDVSLWNSWDMIPAAWAVAIFPASSKGGGHSLAFPDVCRFPAPPQPFVPIAYPNIALLSGDASIKVETKVKTNKATTGVKKGVGKSVKIVTHSIKSGQVATFSPKGKISFRPITRVEREGFNVTLFKTTSSHNAVTPKKHSPQAVGKAKPTTDIKPGLKRKSLTQPKKSPATKPGSTPVRQPGGTAPLLVKPIPLPLSKPIIKPVPLPFKPIIKPAPLPFKPIIKPAPLPLRPIIKPVPLP